MHFCTNTNSPTIPWEIIDEILIFTNNYELAIELRRFAVVQKIRKEFGLYWAIENGQLEYLKYLNARKKGIVGFSYQISLEDAVTRNYFKVLEYCHLNVSPIAEFTRLLDWAAERGDLVMVKFLHSLGCKCTKLAMNNAAQNGNLNVVEWLHYNRNEGYTIDGLNWAARFGHLDVIKFFLDAGAKFDRLLAKQVDIRVSRLILAKLGTE